MEFVFMLTRDDATVANALEIVEAIRPIGLKHIGFKDVGAAPETLRQLTAAIRGADASVWMEIVSTSRDDELRSIALGRDLGVDFLMGGVGAQEGVRLLQGSATRYLPFPGNPVGHPTKLGGSSGRSGGALPRLRRARLRRRRHSRLSGDRGRAARPRRRLPARMRRNGTGRGRRLDRRRRAGRGDPRRRGRRLHHRNSGDRRLLRPRRRAARGAASGGAQGLRGGRRPSWRPPDGPAASIGARRTQRTAPSMKARPIG